jgi:hypothetical protein
MLRDMHSMLWVRCWCTAAAKGLLLLVLLLLELLKRAHVVVFEWLCKTLALHSASLLLLLGCCLQDRLVGACCEHRHRVLAATAGWPV